MELTKDDIIHILTSYTDADVDDIDTDKISINSIHFEDIAEEILKYNKFKTRYTTPTVSIKRGNKSLIQQRNTKEELLNHINDKYPSWDIVESNF